MPLITTDGLRYVLHGDFSNELVSGVLTNGGLQWGECFHIECRDHYLAHRHEADGGLGAMTTLFRNAVCLEDEAELALQIACGVLLRVPTAARTIRALKASVASASLQLPLPPPPPPPPPLPALPALATPPSTVTPPTTVTPPATVTPPLASRTGPTSSTAMAPLPMHTPPSQVPSPGEAEPSPSRLERQPVWTAGQLTLISSCQLSQSAVERTDFRGPRPWRSRLSKLQLEALKQMSGS